MKQTIPSKKCEFIIYLHNKPFHHSGLPEWFNWLGWSSWSGGLGGPGGPGCQCGPGGQVAPGGLGGPGCQCGPGGQGCPGRQGCPGDQVFNVYGLHGPNNQIIEKT